MPPWDTQAFWAALTGLLALLTALLGFITRRPWRRNPASAPPSPRTAEDITVRIIGGDPMAQIIIAPVCSGKSTLAKRMPQKYVDGDALLGETADTSQAWWLSGAVAPAAQAARARRLVDYAVKHPNRTILTDADPHAIVQAARKVAGVEVGWWLPSRAHHSECVRSRTAKVDPGKQPVSAHTLRASRARLMTAAADLKLRRARLPLPSAWDEGGDA